MTPAIVALEIYQGDPFAVVLRFLDADGVTPLDVTGYAFAAQARVAFDRASLEVGVFTFDTTDAATGVIVANLDAATTAEMPASGAWDCEVTPAGGAKGTWFRGPFRAMREVTV